jgi:hypothetical protein
MLVLVLGTLSASPMNCTPTPPVTVATVTNLFMPPPTASPTITCGPVEFNNFQAVSADTGISLGLPIIVASPSTWDPTTGTVSLMFNPNLSVQSGLADIHLYFDATATSGKITGVDGSITGNNSHFSESVCSVGYSSSGTCTPTLAMFTIFSGQNQGVIPITPSTSIGVFKDIQTMSPGALTSFVQTFEVTSSNVIPEPGTLALFGTAVIALAGLVRRRL